MRKYRKQLWHETTYIIWENAYSPQQSNLSTDCLMLDSYLVSLRSRYNVGLGLDGRGIVTLIPSRGKGFFFFHASVTFRPAPYSKETRDAFSELVKRQEREANYSPPSSAEVTHVSSNSTPPYAYTPCATSSHSDRITTKMPRFNKTAVHHISIQVRACWDAMFILQQDGGAPHFHTRLCLSRRNVHSSTRWRCTTFPYRSVPVEMQCSFFKKTAMHHVSTQIRIW